MKQPALKPKTYADYAEIANAYIRPSLGAVSLARLTPDRIARPYARWQREGKHKTALKAHRVLSAALALAVRWQWLGANPCARVDPPKYAPETKADWSRPELAAPWHGDGPDWQCGGLVFKIGRASCRERV